MRLAIVGGRLHLWRNPRAVRARVFDIVAQTAVYPNLTIVSGESPGGGVDIWARQAAALYQRGFKSYPAKWPTAYYFNLRNQQIVDNCDSLIAILAPMSRGTHDTIKRARAKRPDIRVQCIWPEGDTADDDDNTPTNATPRRPKLVGL